MGPLYTHCPHCGFPVVVKELERMFARRCRQCRAQYVPGESGDANGDGRSLLNPARRLRAALRARLRSRRKVLR